MTVSTAPCMDSNAQTAADTASGRGWRRTVISVMTQSVPSDPRSEEHTSELQSQSNLVCRLLLEKKKKTQNIFHPGHFSYSADERILRFIVRHMKIRGLRRYIVYRWLLTGAISGSSRLEPRVRLR